MNNRRYNIERDRALLADLEDRAEQIISVGAIEVELKGLFEELRTVNILTGDVASIVGGLKGATERLVAQDEAEFSEAKRFFDELVKLGNLKALLAAVGGLEMAVTNWTYKNYIGRGESLNIIRERVARADAAATD